MVQEGRAVSLEAALASLGEPMPVGAEDRTPATEPPAGDIAALAGLVEELRALREAVEEQNRLLRDQGERLEALEASLENRELRAALPEGASPAGPSSAEDAGEAELDPEPVPDPAGDRPEPGSWRRFLEWLRGRDT